jgi:hypothetical protein
MIPLIISTATSRIRISVPIAASLVMTDLPW